MNDLTVVGNQEWCAFNNLNVPAVKARIDSGAKTSSIQATNITKFRRNHENHRRKRRRQCFSCLWKSK